MAAYQKKVIGPTSQGEGGRHDLIFSLCEPVSSRVGRVFLDHFMDVFPDIVVINHGDVCTMYVLRPEL